MDVNGLDQYLVNTTLAAPAEINGADEDVGLQGLFDTCQAPRVHQGPGTQGPKDRQKANSDDTTPGARCDFAPLHGHFGHFIPLLKRHSGPYPTYPLLLRPFSFSLLLRISYSPTPLLFSSPLLSSRHHSVPLHVTSSGIECQSIILDTTMYTLTPSLVNTTNLPAHQ